MNTRCSLRRRWMQRALMIGGLSLLAVVVVGQAAGGPGEKEPAKGRTTAKQAAQMVEAIANRNKPPKKVGRRHGGPPRVFPLYPKDYDWKEEERVCKALDELARDTSVEVWEALVQKSNDKRYCIASYDTVSSADLEMLTVGYICYWLAHERLCEPFLKHIPSGPPHAPIQMYDVIKDFPTWRKARKDKALYQMQIEVCEIALRKLQKLKAIDISDKEKAEARKKIQAEIAKLRKSKKPVMEAGGIPAGGIPPPYPRREAERVRESYEKGTLEDFESRLNP